MLLDLHIKVELVLLYKKKDMMNQCKELVMMQIYN